METSNEGKSADELYLAQLECVEGLLGIEARTRVDGKGVKCATASIGSDEVTIILIGKSVESVQRFEDGFLRARFGAQDESENTVRRNLALLAYNSMN